MDKFQKIFFESNALSPAYSNSPRLIYKSGKMKLESGCGTACVGQEHLFSHKYIWNLFIKTKGELDDHPFFI